MPVMLKAGGLVTQPNQLSTREGSLTEATDVVIQRDNIVEPRRGFKKYGTSFPDSNDRAKQFLVYKNRILRHYDSILQFDSDGSGTFSDFNGSYNETQTGLRIKSQEANGNLYFTTSGGIKKISAPAASSFSTASGYIKDSGVAKALDITTLVDYSTTGFFTPLSRVAYRLVFGIRDENNNLILGAPSVRSVITNYSADQSSVVNITGTTPADVNTTDYFFQVYRTSVVTSLTLVDIEDLEPGDEENLVYEANLTATDISNGYVSVTDITPDTFRSGGAPLYTNEITGETIAQTNDRPPIAKDITLFNGSVFYSNTSTVHSLSLNLLSLADFVSTTSQLIVSNGTTTNTYTFVGENEVCTVTTIAPAGIADRDFFLLSGPSNERNYFVWMDKTGTSLAPTDAETIGRIGIRCDISGSANATAVAVAIKTALNTSANIDFSVSNSTTIVTITNVNNGPSTNVGDSIARPTGFAFVTTQAGTGEDIATKKILLSGLATTAQQVDDTSRSLARVLNRTSTEQVYVTYLSGVNDIPGAFLFEKRTLTDSPFYLAINQADLSNQFNPLLPLTKTISIISTGSTPLITTSTAHGLSVGDTVVLYSTNSTPVIDGTYTVATTPLTTTFTVVLSAPITVAGSAGKAFAGSVVSDNEVIPNRIYFSKYQQPEAVPLVNFLDVGRRDSAILRILPLRDSLFILKEDATYRLSGIKAPDFSVSLLDSSTIYKAPDAAQVLNNLIYAVTNQDIITVSESGVQIISRPIENRVVKLTDYTNFSTASFGVAYEKDRSYLFFTVENANDTVANQVFRFNTFTNSWVKWAISKTCGVVNHGDDKLYLGASDVNYIEIERKALNRTDHADRESTLNVIAGGISGATVELSSVATINIGDALVQTQYLTIARFNRLLRKLDRDFGVGDNDYYSTLVMVAGDNLTSKMTSLVAKLNADPNLNQTYVFSGTTVFATIQTEYNVIIGLLNLSAEATFYKDYQTSTGTYDFESSNLEINTDTNIVTLQYELDLMAGTITVYEGINSIIEWVPQHFGDPSILKQINMGSLIFEDNVFTTATLSYASDLSPSFEDIEFEGFGLGDWGFFINGNQSWGGEGNQVPERTFIPQQKQRCRFLRPKFSHINAREKYAILGWSMDPRPFSNNGYK